MTGLARVGPLGAAPGVSNLVDVQSGELVLRRFRYVAVEVVAGHGVAAFGLVWT
jgi:hypothetical protein